MGLLICPLLRLVGRFTAGRSIVCQGKCGYSILATRTEASNHARTRPREILQGVFKNKRSFQPCCGTAAGSERLGSCTMLFGVSVSEYLSR